MNKKDQQRCKVGELRPSQALTTFGIGSIIDLPHLSVMVMGLEDWPLKDTVEIGEQRLLASVKEVLGHQVQALRSAPVVPDTYQVNPFDPSSLVGIPVAPFPRWMVCPFCRRLAPLSSGLFKLETSYRTDQIRYVHANCTKPGKPTPVVPARFIVACKNGHLDDFPWREFVHNGPTNCTGGLKLLEPSATGEAANIFVQCEGANCGANGVTTSAYTSGTYIGKDAAGQQHLLTCAHGKKAGQKVRLIVGKEWVNGYVMACDEKNDIGDVILLGDERTLQAVPLADYGPAAGDSVHVIGWGHNVKADKRTVVKRIEKNGWVRVEAVTRSGDSGGALLHQGRIVGVHIRGDKHDGWSVPIEKVHEFYEQSGSWKNAEGQRGP